MNLTENKRPYKLPEPLYCEPDEEITIDFVNKYIRLHEERLPRYRYLENLYKGFHNIFLQPEKEQWKPDNRLAVNFPKYVTDIFMGFGYGIPIKKHHPDEKTNEVFKDFDRRNGIIDHEFEMIKNVCKFGHAFEYFYQDEDAHTRVARNTPIEAFIVYENTLRRKARCAIRYGYDETGAVKFGEVLECDKSREFKGDLFTEGSEKSNPYGKIPIVEWVMNEERMSLFESIAGLTEVFNKTIAEKANDVDAFAEAYLLILGAELDENGVYKIRDNRIINMYGTDNAKDILVQFLTKPTADDTQENLLDRMEALIHKISMIVDISNENFGNSTGEALGHKLLPTSNVVKFFNRKIEKALKKRYKLFCCIPANIANKNAWEDIEFTFSENLPKNIKNEAETAKALEGVTSKETQLSVLSIVPDVSEEMKKIEKEEDEVRKKAEKMSNSILGFGATTVEYSATEEGLNNGQ